MRFGATTTHDALIGLPLSIAKLFGHCLTGYRTTIVGVGVAPLGFRADGFDSRELANSEVGKINQEWLTIFTVLGRNYPSLGF